MKKNNIQFQKGLSLGELQRRYGSVEACRDAVAQLRWPSGFVCPECDNTTFLCAAPPLVIPVPPLPPSGGSLVAGNSVPAGSEVLRTWFLALYLVSQGKKGMS